MGTQDPSHVVSEKLSPAMAELPRYDAMLKPTLEALAQLGRSGTVEEIDNAVAARLNLTQAQLDMVYPTSSAAIIPDRLSWARSYLKIAGLIANERRGVWLPRRPKSNLTASPPPNLKKP